MSKYSTSKMLGKLTVGQKKTSADHVEESSDEIGETFAVPQLKPSKKPKMEEVLNNILRASPFKRSSPMDKS